MSTTSTTICTASTSYKKKPGQLILTSDQLRWIPQSNGTNASELSVENTTMSALFASKEGGPRIMLKIAFNPSPLNSNPLDDSYNFTFTSAATALSDREKFKGELSGVIARNREREAEEASGNAATTTNGGVGGVSLSSKGKGKEKASSTGSNTPSGQSTPNPLSTTTTGTNPSQSSIFRLRKQVLQSSPQLLQLHRELVLTSQITESEFWEGRESLLESLRSEESLMRGKSGEMVDPKTVTGQNGEVTVKVTPMLIREIFEEFPVVLKAYNDNVPEPLDESAFWTRYFQSKLFNRNRTTNRAAVDAIKDDPIFDKYLGQEDDGIEPQRQTDHEIYRLLDLAATEEDQHEITNQPRDFTMKAGGQRASLPLMRRFNEHSERLLNQTLGATGDRPRTYVDPGNAGDRRYYSEIELSDLTQHRPPDRISLTLSNNNPSRNLNNNSGGNTEDGNKGEEETLEVLAKRKMEEERLRDVIVEEWQGRLNEFEVDSKAARGGMRDMMNNISHQNERNRKTGGGNSHGLSRTHQLNVESISTTSLEFLRHFWSAILPPKPNDSSTFASAPTKERTARAEKFKGYLEKSRERVEKAVKDAKGDGEEVGKRVQAALQPIVEGIEAAVRTYKSKHG